MAAGQKLSDDYVEHRYHQPSDEWRADWDLTDPVTEDTKALYLAGTDARQQQRLAQLVSRQRIPYHPRQAAEVSVRLSLSDARRYRWAA